MNHNTLFLRLEGPLQAWGHHESKFVIRRAAEAPTKSGIIGLLCCALGLSRKEATQKQLSILTPLRMGVRVDVPGVSFWDYHTVGAKLRMPIAEEAGKTKKDALLSRREYICDASYLVALQGDPALIQVLFNALKNPVWTLYLGRKCCPPSRPITEHGTGLFPDLLSALTSIPWRPRLPGDPKPSTIKCLLEWTPSEEEPLAPDSAEIWYDVPVNFDPPAHQARFVVVKTLTVSENGDVALAKEPAQSKPKAAPRPRADYNNSQYKRARKERLKADYELCVFCKQPAQTIQHITYRRAGGNETHDDLRSLCRLCHDAVTMLEYGYNMGLDRINPEDPKWRDAIIEKRNEIIKYRSLENRRRMLEATQTQELQKQSDQTINQNIQSKEE